jgi:transposase
VDPDARHGRKSAEKKFVGYKAQIVMGERGLIAGIDGMLGNRHDTWGVGEMMAELAGTGITPAAVVGDKAYGDEELGMGLERNGMRMVTPLKERSEARVFANDRFELIRERGRVPRMRCPGGEETEESDVTWRGRRFHFTQCGACALKGRCTTDASRTVLASRSYEYRKRKAAFNETGAYRELMRRRGAIERKNGQLKNRFGMRRCRYRGLAKFRLQCFFSALAANIQRWVQIHITAPPSCAVALAAIA